MSDLGHDSLTGKTAQAIGLAVLVFLALYLVRDPTDTIWGAPGSGLDLLGRFTQQGAPKLAGADGTVAQPQEEVESSVEQPQASAPGIARRASPERAAVRALHDPGGRGLEHVRESLARLGAGQPSAITRILHYGDSLLDTDFVAGAARRALQAEFGDGGHGFINAAKPWPWYRHWDVVHEVRGNWNVNLVTHSIAPDGRYGLGGAVFRPWGGSASFGTAADGPIGNRVSRFEIAYLEQPGGGSIEIAIDGRPRGRLLTDSSHRPPGSSDAPPVAPGFRTFEVPDGAHTLELRGSNGDVRLFGVVLERSSGVVYDTLGINGARLKILSRFDEAHWAEQLRHRAPDLVVLGFGMNESENPHYPVDGWPELPQVVERLRRAVPEASCMLVGPPDRVDRTSGRTRSRPVIRRLSDRQRDVALAHGCAFFDLQEAMGGEGAAARWARMNPRLVAGDLVHPTPEGAARIGRMLADAIAAGVQSGRERRAAR